MDYPKDLTMRISHESIYRWVYRQIRNSAKDLKGHLRHGRYRRRKRISINEIRVPATDKVSIDQRPALVETKCEPGHWEGDTVTGARHKGYIGTYVERTHKYLIAFPIQYKKSDYFALKSGKAFSRIPLELRKSLTVDNGPEFASHKKLASKTCMPVYFAHPYHSWERGLNEHTNGLLRQYLPKGRRLMDLEQRELDRYVDLINNRPRKALGYLTPAESFLAAIRALQS